MKQIFNEEELTGKTVQRTGYIENKFFIFFTDNTFCIISGCGYDEHDVTFNDDGFSTEPDIYNYSSLEELGLIDEKTALGFRNKAAAKNKKQKRKSDIERLKELREKYPNE